MLLTTCIYSFDHKGKDWSTEATKLLAQSPPILTYFRFDGRWLNAEPAKVFVVFDVLLLLSALDATFATRREVTDFLAMLFPPS
jgi:hypothetical protein